MGKARPQRPGSRSMLEHLSRIDGLFAGVDPLFVVLGVTLLAAVIGFTAVVARQVAQLTPKVKATSKAGGQEVAKAGAEFESWTERPPEQRNYDAEYYSLYGSNPAARRDYIGPAAPAAPSAPRAAGRDVVATLGPPATGASASPWAPVPEERLPPAGPRAHAPLSPPAAPAGPTDEVVAPTHSRGARASGANPWQNLPDARPVDPSFERTSPRAGAPPPGPPLQQVPRGQPAPRAAAPQARRPAAPTAPPAGTTRPGTARVAFRTPPGQQSVVGAADIGVKEGAQLSPERKAIRCPKCSTVFPGPAKRPATVKCPACGTGGLMK